jgi:outer membrane protein
MKFKSKILLLLLMGSTISLPSYALTASTNKNLIEVYQEAINNSPLLKSQEATMSATSEIVGVNLGQALPNVAVVGSLSATNANTGGGTAVNASGSFKTGSLNLVLNQQIFNYGVLTGYQYSRQVAAQAGAVYQGQQQSFILQVAQAYFNILLAEDNVSFSEANLKASKSTLDRTQLMFNNGMSTDADVKQAQATFYTAQATLTKDKNTLKVSHYDLYSLTGVLQESFAPLRDNVTYVDPTPNDVNSWVSLAKKHNYDLIAQRYATEANYSLVGVANSLFLPSLSLTASYSIANNVGNDAIIGITANHTRSGYIGLNLTWNIFNGGTDFATKIQAAKNYEAQQYTTIDATRSLEQTTSNDFNNVISFVNQVRAFTQSVKASKLSYEQFLEQYKVGTATVTDVLDQQKLLFQAMTNLASAKYNYIISVLQLKYDAGTISVQDINHFNGWLKG